MDIQEKARELFAWSATPRTITECEDFIRSIMKPKVSKAFVGKVTARIYCDRKSVEAIKSHVREAFKEIGLEVE